MTPYEKALSYGYSHEEILNFLSPRIEEARKHGYTDDEIYGYLGVRRMPPQNTVEPKDSYASIFDINTAQPPKTVAPPQTVESEDASASIPSVSFGEYKAPKAYTRNETGLYSPKTIKPVLPNEILEAITALPKIHITTENYLGLTDQDKEAAQRYKDSLRKVLNAGGYNLVHTPAGFKAQDDEGNLYDLQSNSFLQSLLNAYKTDKFEIALGAMGLQAGSIAGSPLLGGITLGAIGAGIGNLIDTYMTSKQYGLDLRALDYLHEMNKASTLDILGNVGSLTATKALSSAWEKLSEGSIAGAKRFLKDSGVSTGDLDEVVEKLSQYQTMPKDDDLKRILASVRKTSAAQNAAKDVIGKDKELSKRIIKEAGQLADETDAMLRGGGMNQFKRSLLAAERKAGALYDEMSGHVAKAAGDGYYGIGIQKDVGKALETLIEEVPTEDVGAKSGLKAIYNTLFDASGDEIVPKATTMSDLLRLRKNINSVIYKNNVRNAITYDVLLSLKNDVDNAIQRGIRSATDSDVISKNLLDAFGEANRKYGIMAKSREAAEPVMKARSEAAFRQAIGNISTQKGLLFDFGGKRYTTPQLETVFSALNNNQRRRAELSVLKSLVDQAVTTDGLGQRVIRFDLLDKALSAAPSGVFKNTSQELGILKDLSKLYRNEDDLFAAAAGVRPREHIRVFAEGFPKPSLRAYTGMFDKFLRYFSDDAAFRDAVRRAVRESGDIKSFHKNLVNIYGGAHPNPTIFDTVRAMNKEITRLNGSMSDPKLGIVGQNGATDAGSMRYGAK